MRRNATWQRVSGSGKYTACTLLYRSPGTVQGSVCATRTVTHGHQTILVYVTYSTDSEAAFFPVWWLRFDYGWHINYIYVVRENATGPCRGHAAPPSKKKTDLLFLLVYFSIFISFWSRHKTPRPLLRDRDRDRDRDRVFKIKTWNCQDLKISVSRPVSRPTTLIDMIISKVEFPFNVSFTQPGSWAMDFFNS